MRSCGVSVCRGKVICRGKVGRLMGWKDEEEMGDGMVRCLRHPRVSGKWLGWRSAEHWEGISWRISVHRVRATAGEGMVGHPQQLGEMTYANGGLLLPAGRRWSPRLIHQLMPQTVVVLLQTGATAQSLTVGPTEDAACPP